MSTEETALALKKERETFHELWLKLFELQKEGKLENCHLGMKTLLGWQKKMMLTLGSEVNFTNTTKIVDEMTKYLDLYNTYAPSEESSKVYTGNLNLALQLQRRMNKKCISLIKKAEKKQFSVKYPRMESMDDASA
jgi:hypothetical protein